MLPRKSNLFLSCLMISLLMLNVSEASVPIVVNTWAFTDATASAWSTLMGQNTTAIDAVTAGCTTCEVNQCNKTVGYGGSPDESGETTLDAMIFDGTAMDMGAVGGLRRVKSAIKVAQHVLKYTKHSLLVGDLAAEFAAEFKFKIENLATDESIKMWHDWKFIKNCQPNFWQNVKPDPIWSCGPYKEGPEAENRYQHFDSLNHDTIGMIAIDKDANIAAGTSSNGASHKIPGRVGDSPLPGAGAYADSEVGAAVATGDGDVMMRFLPSFLAVEEMRRGSTPTQAAKTAIARITRKYPDFMGAVVAVSNKGDFGAACNGIDKFPFSVASEELGGVVLKTIPCTQPEEEPRAHVLQIV